MWGLVQAGQKVGMVQGYNRECARTSMARKKNAWKMCFIETSLQTLYRCGECPPGTNGPVGSRCTHLFSAIGASLFVSSCLLTLPTDESLCALPAIIQW